jgi:hypothetical protein
MGTDSFSADDPLEGEFTVEEKVQIHERLQDPFQPEKHQVLVIPAKDQGNPPIQPSVNQAAIDVEGVDSMLDVQNSGDHDPETSHLS